MKTSARLILILTIAVGVVMSAGGYFILRQREKSLEQAMLSEVRAHAVTLRPGVDRSDERQPAHLRRGSVLK
jgi:hypothetical protein